MLSDTLKMLAHLFTLAAMLAIAGCAGKPDNVIGIDNFAKPAASVAGVTRQEVFIATTRAPSDDPALLFTAERDLTGLNFARVEVVIPPDHKRGHVERPDSVPPDPSSDFLILDTVKYDTAPRFRTALDRALSRKQPGQRDIMLFVHGFNTDIVDAIMRTAQIAHDSGFDGVPVVFSWASAGKTLDYVYDLNSALQARDGLLETAGILVETRGRDISLIAHSMGNILTVEAMRQGQITGKFNRPRKLKNVILASPDIDIDLFKTQMRVFPQSDRRFYVLVSSDDKALAFSRRLAGGVNRVGDDDPEDLAKLGVTVIDLSKVDDTSSLNHTKFADSPEIVRLIGRRLNEGDLKTSNAADIPVVGNIPAAINVLSGGAGTGKIIAVN